jgi:hypothetical protein
VPYNPQVKAVFAKGGEKNILRKGDKFNFTLMIYPTHKGLVETNLFIVIGYKRNGSSEWKQKVIAYEISTFVIPNPYGILPIDVITLRHNQQWTYHLNLTNPFDRVKRSIDVIAITNYI